MQASHLKNDCVGAAEGCELLMLFFKDKIKRSQPSAAPTWNPYGDQTAAL
jgi:hypothetical protein